MRLNPVAKAAAIILQTKCPFVTFTSGRRDRWAQAQAMAGNVAVERGWIRNTYMRAAPFETWLDQHPEAQTVEQLAHGFYGILTTMPDADVEKISKHLGGNAFDILPIVTTQGVPTAEGHQVIDVIRSLPGLDKFLQKEGNLIRWHAQFHESAEI